MSKATGLREKTENDLVNRRQDLTEQLFKMRFQSATGALDDPQKVKGARREIARINTILREREIEAGKKAE
ncbi:MAG: 50S ribosomal protein L29 [Acidobacteria bacterium]|nr:50S ribosomal protein L29 [Acidobacteriota bacterium]